MKSTTRKRISQLALAATETGLWMIDEGAVASLHESVRRLWDVSEIPSDAFAAVSGMAPDDDDGPDVVGGIGVVHISGVIRSKPDVWTRLGFGVSNSQVAEDVSQLLARSDVNGVLLVVDSPGGSALGNEEAARKIRAAAEKSGKAVWAVADGMMASAAYYLSAAASRIVVAPGSVVGSIGCLCVHAHWRPEDAEFTVTRFGSMKAVPNPYEPIGDAGRAEHQRTVDQMGAMFLATVAELRGVSLDAAREQFGDGMVFLEASEMMTRRLVDARVESVRHALSLMQATYTASPASLQQRLEASCGGTNHESGKRAAVTATHEERTMTPRIKAALFARGLISVVDAADDVCESALRAFVAGRGIAQPSAEQDVLNALNGTGTPQGNSGQSVQDAHDREQAEARAEARREEVERRRAIEQRGAAIGAAQADIDAAIASERTADQAVSWMVDQVAAARPPVITTSEAGVVAFGRDALDALLLRAQCRVENPSAQAASWARNGVTPLHLAQTSLEVQGVRFDRMGRPEEIARLALTTGVPRSGILMGADIPLNAPASFPNLLSNLANRLFEEGMQRAAPSYPAWTARSRMDLPDLKESPLISRSQPYVMDEVINEESLKEFQLAEEALSIIQVRRFANKFGWTPVMVANDDLGAFAEGMIAFGSAWENTVNLLCLNLLTGNVTLLDTFAIFDNSNHGNDVASGAAPTTAQWKAMQDKVSAQRPVGGKGYVRGSLAVLLCPPQLVPEARQLLADFGSIPEIKNPATDATINVYRGTGRVVAEPELQANSATKYYGMIDPVLQPAVVRVYQRGWGDGVQRRAWTDTETGTAWTAFEGRVGAAVKDYRPIVRNNGA